MRTPGTRELLWAVWNTEYFRRIPCRFAERDILEFNILVRYDTIYSSSIRSSSSSTSPLSSSFVTGLWLMIISASLGISLNFLTSVSVRRTICFFGIVPCNITSLTFVVGGRVRQVLVSRSAALRLGGMVASRFWDVYLDSRSVM